MKRNWIYFIALCLSFFAFAPALLAAETFTLDPNHSYVLYHINHLGFSTQTGKWPAEGTLILDKQKPQLSKVTVTIPIAGMVTGNNELNEHLQGKNFFDIAHYPVATFTSTKITLQGKDAAKVQGTLTLHGVSKPVTLDVKFTKEGVNPITNKPTVGFSGKTKLKRSDFGITTLVPSLGDEVTLDIQVEAAKAG